MINLSNKQSQSNTLESEQIINQLCPTKTTKWQEQRLERWLLGKGCKGTLAGITNPLD
jgi:hypothetical protein